MAEILKSLGLGGKGEEKAVAQTLKNLDKQKSPLLMEIEQAQIHFRSVLAVKKGVVVVAKPAGLGAHLKKGSIVRFSVPEEPGRDIRLQVTSAHFNLSSGNAVFICKMPTVFSEGTRRRTTRFNTSRFGNLHLFVPNLNERFRIIDLSMSGLKIYVQGKIAELFPIGTPITPARIHISKHSADLDMVIPRAHRANSVGCEISVPEEGPARKYITRLIQSLQETEERQLLSAEF